MIYDFILKDNHGSDVHLADYKGKVLLIVNTATHCGFTSQYKELEAMYEKYQEQGFEVIDIPSNQFMGQAPEDDGEIEHFCVLNYQTKFARMQKSDVNGENELPLYTYLKSQQPFKGFGNSVKGMGMSALLRKIDWNYKKNPDIKWNFTKFLVDREGNVVDRFEPTDSMQDLEKKVQQYL